MKSYNIHNNPLWENNPKNNKLNQYQAWLQRRNLTAETIKIKLRHVKKFGKQSLTTDNIVQFLRMNSQYSPYHLENLRNSLSSYAKFLKIYNEIEWDIVNKVIPSIQPKLCPTISKDELELLKNSNNLKHQKNNDRDSLILDFFLNTGLRISELVNIRHSDYRNNQLKIHGKGNKIRFLPLPSCLAQHFKQSSNYLFQTKNGKPLHSSQVRRMIYGRKQKAGLTKHISPHTFRRSFATLLNNEGVKLTSIQKLLGHSDINTTIGYIHNSYEQIAQDCSKLWGIM